MKKAMDLFGTALYDRHQGVYHPFYMEYGEFRQEHPLERYFRSTDQLSPAEKLLISLCRGEILDVGCATGNYIPAMAKMGNVTGIDISSKVIDIARERGLKNCLAGDIFNFNPNKKFDTITLLENNIGMGETVDGTRRLLIKLSDLLESSGQILLILTGRARHADYFTIELTPVYREVKGTPFHWINYSAGYLAKICATVGLDQKILSGNQHYSLIKLTKSR